MVNLSPIAKVIEDLVRMRNDLLSPLLDDLRQVVSLVESRGISVVMIDFPDAAKVLDASLSAEYIDYQRLPHTMRKLEDGRYIPTLFRCLFEELFRPQGGMIPEPDINLIFFLRQLLLLYKKVDMPCPPETVDKAVVEFLQIENQMRNYTLPWHLDHVDMTAAFGLSFGDGNSDAPLFGERGIPRRLLEAMDYVSRLVSNSFPVLDPYSIIPKHGPGAVSDLKTGTDKYLFENWPSKLANVFEFQSYGLHNYGADDGAVNPKDLEPPACLIAVPKTLKSPRLIASEPTAHQFLQQGMMRWFRNNLRKPLSLSLDLTNQDTSQKAALLASKNGLSSTIDLSSASDRLSCWVVERFFRQRADILSALHSVRTRTLIFSVAGVPGRILLKKYANQGSAVTFTLQSIIYASICAAAYLFERGKPLSPKSLKAAFAEVRAFGDDLIVPADVVYATGTLLSYLGLKVNWGKTHRSGQFRESCGMDAYGGLDITPMYLSSLEPGADFSGLSSWVDCSNVAYERGLWSLSEYMVKHIPEKYRQLLPVSPKPLGCLYLRTRQKMTLVSSDTRWDKNTQSMRIRGLTAKVKKSKGDRVGSQDLLHYFLGVVGDKRKNVITDIFSVSRRRSFAYRTILQVRWVDAQASMI